MNENDKNDQDIDATENYAVSEFDINSEEMNPVLIELIEKSKE